MANKRLVLVAATLGLLLGLAPAQAAVAENSSLTQIEQLGKYIFFDASLSSSETQSCASCHAPDAGFTAPDSAINASGAVIPGAVGERFGNRKPPSAAYAGDSPILSFDTARGVWVGGMFWDGRASGDRLGDPLAEQAQGPFLNPLEQNMPQAKQVCLKVAHASYAALFEAVWGLGTLKESYINKNVDLTYERIARSIAAYEESTEVNPFSSKFDAFWDAAKADGKDITQITFSTQGVGSGATARATVQSGRIVSVAVTNSGSGYLVAPTITFGSGMGI